MRTNSSTRNLMLLVLSPLSALSLAVVAGAANLPNPVTTIAAANSGPWE